MVVIVSVVLAVCGCKDRDKRVAPAVEDAAVVPADARGAIDAGAARVRPEGAPSIEVPELVE